MHQIGAVLFQFSRKPQFITAGRESESDDINDVIKPAILCELHCKVTKKIGNIG